MASDREMLLAGLLSAMADRGPDGQPLSEQELESRLDELTNDELQQLYSVGRFVRTLEDVGASVGLENVAAAAQQGVEASAEGAFGQVPERVGKFTDLELAGTGGFASVYRAFDTELERTVALKIPHQNRLASHESGARFRREARAAAVLSHDAIVVVYEAGAANGVEYISMEWIDGSDFQSWLIAHRDSISIQEAAAAIHRLAAGLATAHDRGILHRDVKPANVLVPDGDQNWFERLKLTDFGLARSFSDRAGDQLTQSDSILGTPAYMSPEQALSNSEITTATDVHSLGALLYELLTGTPPHKRATYTATLMAIGNEPVKDLRRVRPEVPADLAAICMKCLEFEATNRYPSARELAADLQNFLDNQPVSARSIGRVGKLVRWCRRNPSATGWGSVALVSLIIGGLVAGWFLRQSILDQRRALFAEHETERQIALKENSLDSIAAVINQANPILGRKSMLTASQLLHATRADVQTRFANDPEAQAELFSELAKGYMSLTLYAEAVECRQQALSLLNQARGERSLEAMQQLQLLAQAQFSAGQLAESLDNNRELLKRCKQARLENTFEQQAKLSLAEIHIELGQPDNAIQMLAFADAETVDYGEQRRGRLLGKAYRESGLLEQALQVTEDFWRFQQELGEHSSAALKAKQEYVETLAQAGQTKRAIGLARELLRDWSGNRGSDSQEAMEMALLNGWLYRDVGRIQIAEQTADRAIAAGLDRYGESHELITNLKRLKARCRAQAGDVEGAIAILLRATRLREAETSIPGKCLFNCIRELSRQYRFTNQPQLAIELLNQYRPLIEEPNVWEVEAVSRLRMEFIQATAANGRPGEVIELCRRHLDMLRDRTGDRLIDLHFVWFQLMNLLFQDRQNRAALAEAREFVAEMNQRSANVSPRLRVKAMSFLAIALVENGLYEDAAQVSELVHDEPDLYKPYNSLMMSVRGAALANGVLEASFLRTPAARAQSDFVQDGIVMQKGTVAHFMRYYQDADFNLRFLILMCAERLATIQEINGRDRDADETRQMIDALKQPTRPSGE